MKFAAIEALYDSIKRVYGESDGQIIIDEIEVCNLNHSSLCVEGIVLWGEFPQASPDELDRAVRNIGVALTNPSEDHLTAEQWEAIEKLYSGPEGRISINHSDKTTLRRHLGLMEDFIARRADLLAGIQNKNWSPERATEIERLQNEYRELRALEEGV